MNRLETMKLVFIGAGNMAEAIIRGLIGRAVCRPDQITVTDVRREQLNHFKTSFGVAVATDNPAAVRGADAVVLAVKPQVMAEVLAGLRGALPETALVISIAAGKRTELLESALGGAVRLTRVMPNTPALVGAGVSAVCAGSRATAADMDLTVKLFEAVGSVVRVAESEMDAVTALSGSGPAYVFYLAEAMLAAGKKLGVSDALARELVTGTIGGAAKLMAGSNETPEVLRAKVTSKGGTTAAAVAVLDAHAVKNAVTDAVEAAAQRSKELSGSN